MPSSLVSSVTVKCLLVAPAVISSKVLDDFWNESIIIILIGELGVPEI